MSRSFFSMIGTLCAVALLTLWATRDAKAAYKFCSSIQPVFQDSGVGEDFFVSGTVPARSHRLHVYRNNVLVSTGTADASGCTTNTFTLAGTYKVTTWAKVQPDPTVTFLIRRDVGDTQDHGWNNTWNNLPASTGAAVVEKRSTMVGTTLDGLFRVSALLIAVPNGSLMANSTFTILAEAAESDCSGCAFPADMRLELGFENGFWLNRRKSVVLHELAHLVQHRLFGSFGKTGVTADDDYCESVAEAICQCGLVAPSEVDPWGRCGGEQLNRLHCLNSREHLHAAFDEGFAHAYAARLLNNSAQSDATYPYYKNLVNSNGVGFQPPPVAHNVVPATRYRWMETKCNSAMAQRGTEMDWLGFIYNLLNKTTNAYLFADLRTVMRSLPVCNGTCAGQNVTWAMMSSGVNAQAGFPLAKKQHFTDRGIDFGVDN